MAAALSFRLHDGAVATLPAAFVARCSTLRELVHANAEVDDDAASAPLPLGRVSAATLTLLARADLAAYSEHDGGDHGDAGAARAAVTDVLRPSQVRLVRPSDSHRAAGALTDSRACVHTHTSSAGTRPRWPPRWTAPTSSATSGCTRRCAPSWRKRVTT
jgi:hypothetical protein